MTIDRIPRPDSSHVEGPRIARVEIGGRIVWVEFRGEDAIEIGERFSLEARGGVLGTIDQCRFLAPLEHDNHIINLMGNFTGRTDRRGPGIFIKPITTASGYGDAIVWPKSVPNVNMEAELGVVIARTCKNVPESEALDYVFGSTVTNDVTSFGTIEEDGFDSLSMRFKMYDTFMPIGPWIVPGLVADDRHMVSRLNGKVIQDVMLTNMDFNVAQTISWISQAMTLRPGDIISMGTPLGFIDMAEGDVVECRIEGVGSLINHVIRDEG